MGVEETVSKVIVYHGHPTIGSFVRLTNGNYITYYKNEVVEVGLGAPSLEKEGLAKQQFEHLKKLTRQKKEVLVKV